MAQLSAFHSSTQLTKAAGSYTASSPFGCHLAGPSISFSARVIVATTGFICLKASALAASSARCVDTNSSAPSTLAALAHREVDIALAAPSSHVEQGGEAIDAGGHPAT
jgi:hypothetical protein